MVSRLSLCGSYYVAGKPVALINLAGQGLDDVVDHKAARDLAHGLFRSGFFGAVLIEPVMAPEPDRRLGQYQATLHHPTWNQQRPLWLVQIANESSIVLDAELGN